MEALILSQTKDLSMQSPQSDISATSTSCRMANSTANSSIETVFPQNLKVYNLFLRLTVILLL